MSWSDQKIIVSWDIPVVYVTLGFADTYNKLWKTVKTFVYALTTDGSISLQDRWCTLCRWITSCYKTWIRLCSIAPWIWLAVFRWWRWRCGQCWSRHLLRGPVYLNGHECLSGWRVPRGSTDVWSIVPYMAILRSRLDSMGSLLDWQIFKIHFTEGELYRDVRPLVLRRRS